MAHRLEQHLRLRRGIGRELAPQSLGELLVGAERSGSIPHPIQHGHQSAHAAFVVGGQDHRPPSPVDAVRGAPVLLRPLGHRPRGARRPRLESSALRLEPLAELRGHAGEEEPGQEVARVQLQRRLRLLPVERLLESGRVAPERGGVEADVLVAAAHGDGTQAASEEMETLPQGVAALFQVEVGPEEPEQRIAAMKTVGGRGGEVGEQAEALGLGHDGASPVGRAMREPHINSAKRPDSDESGHCCFCVQMASPAGVTVRGRCGDGEPAYCTVNIG